MQLVAVGWDIYDRTGETLQLGLVGLVQVIPVVLLALPAGQVIDRLDRRRVIIGALFVMCACSLGLAAISWLQADYRWIYLCLFLNGVARAFWQPAKAALIPLIVSRSRFANAVTWSTSGFQLATVAGPALGGWMIAGTHAAAGVYLLDAALSLVFVAALRGLRARPTAPSSERLGVSSLLAGAAFVWRTKLILGAISLDMFAVLLGGATALLPVYAKDILQAGPEGLGWLRAAPGLGALLTSFVLTRRPPIQRSRSHVAGVGGCLWRGHPGVRPVASVLAVVGHAVSDWRLRHGQRRDPAHVDPTPDAGRHAGPGVRGQRNVHWDLERVGGVRVGHRRAPMPAERRPGVRSHGVGRDRWCGHDSRRTLGRPGVSGTSPAWASG